jgi:hypothetical protein
VTLRVEDLRGEARDAFRMWRDTFGLSEPAAMNALVEDGVITLSEDEQLARRFSKLFGLSEAEARRAVAGRDGPTVRTVSETAGPASGAPQPGDALRLVRRIEELAAGLCYRGVSVEKALREAAFAVFEAAPDSLQDWIAVVVDRRWPGLWVRRGSTSGGKGNSSGRTSGSVAK